MDEEPTADVAEEEYDDYEEDLEDELEAEDASNDGTLSEEDLEEGAEQVIAINEKDANHRTIYIVPNSKRVTSEIIQWPEMVEAIGIRASQIENSSPVFTDVSGYKDPIAMAKKEFIDRQNPLIIRRTLKKTDTYHIVEQWKVRKMTFPVTTREIHDLTSKQIAETIAAIKK